MIHKVIQRHINRITNFQTQTWVAHHEKGFGHTELEYWLGKFRSLLKNKFPCQLLVLFFFFRGGRVVLI